MNTSKIKIIFTLIVLSLLASFNVNTTLAAPCKDGGYSYKDYDEDTKTCKDAWCSSGIGSCHRTCLKKEGTGEGYCGLIETVSACGGTGCDNEDNNTCDPTTVCPSDCNGSIDQTPVNVSPANQEIITGYTPTFTWQGIGAWGEDCEDDETNDKYIVKYRELQTGETSCSGIPLAGYTQACETNKNSTSCALNIGGQLAEDKTFCWYVEAVNGAAAKASTPTLFKTQVACENLIAPPQPAPLFGPANGAIISQQYATLNWGTINSWGKGCPTNNNRYNVYLGQGSCASNPPMYVSNTQNHTGSSSYIYNTPTLAANSTYCWYVQTHNGSASADSERREFSTCTWTAPVAEHNLLRPYNGSSTSMKPTLEWYPLYDAMNPETKWGETCGQQPARRYYIYIADKPIDKSCYDIPVDVPGGYRLDGTADWEFYPNAPETNEKHVVNRPLEYNKEYCWFVRAGNGVYNTDSPQKWSFKTPAEVIDVTGYIWNAQNKSCDAGPFQNNNVSTNNDEAYVRDSDDINSNEPFDVDNNSGKFNAKITWNNNILDGICAEDIKFDPLVPGGPGLPGKLACTNKGVITNNCIYFYGQPKPSPSDPIYLGFTKTEEGWFQSLLGDIFAGDNLSQVIPQTTVTIPKYDTTPYLVDSAKPVTGDKFSYGLALGKNIYVTDNAGSTKITAGGTGYTNYSVDPVTANPEDKSNIKFPSDFSFEAPAELTGKSCSDIFAATKTISSGLHKVNGSCTLTTDMIYTISGTEKIAVVYIGGNLTINKSIKSTATNESIVFIVNGTLKVDDAFGQSPTGLILQTSPADIKASFIVKDSIMFETGGAKQDTTVIVEGFLLSKTSAYGSSVQFNRDRGPTKNEYPGVVVKYIPNDLMKLYKLQSPELLTNTVNWRYE